MVVDKPPGLETAGRTPDDPRSLQYRLAAQLGRPVWAVHQLDRETSGANVFVRKRSLVAPWQAKLASGRKVYLAIVHGRFEAASVRVDAPLRYDEARRRWAVGEGREARSLVRRLAAADAFSLLEVELLTGRTHQARVHLAHLGHPLAGEKRYRDPPSSAHPRHALHAFRIELAGLRFEAPVPADLGELAARVGLAGALPSPESAPSAP
ncbi:MAG TPA: RNA pseudouridine synthase [Sandaracinaceae bacterium]